MSAFDDSCKRAATEFLQTVVVVDNMASYEAGDQLATEAVQVSELTAPDIFSSADAADAETVAPRTPPDALNAAIVSQSFASAGLVCSILRPTKSDRLEEEVLEAAARADILVLDWQMDDQGGLAITITRRLIEQDEQVGGRLRLIAIYTAQSPLAPVREGLAEGFPKLTRATDRFALSYETTKVIFLTKAAASVAPGEAGLSVDPENLSDRLVQEFAAFAGGLLPNATLAAISGLRRHTHRVLARFDKSLDGPFLTHRTLLASPVDAEQYAANLIMAELSAQVPLDSIVGEFLGKESIREYVEHRVEAGLRPSLMLTKSGDKLQELDIAKVCLLIEEGISALSPEDVENYGKLAKIEKPDKLYPSLKAALHERLYALIDSDVESGKANHERFAIAAKLKRDNSTFRPEVKESWPSLRLGSLVVEMVTGTHWICLTPLCDAERIPTDGGRFMFAYLAEGEDGSEFLVRDGDLILRLTGSNKRTHLATHLFEPDELGVVKARVIDGAAIFESLAENPPWNEPVRFRWLGELKPLHAQRFVHRFASSISRIGLDDFEWHRKRQRTQTEE